MNLSTISSQCSSETNLLVNACRSYCTQDAGTLEDGVHWEAMDWNALVREAEEQGVAPILYHVLKTAKQHHMPAPAFSRLQAFHYRNVHYILRAQAVLHSIVDRFNENDLSLLLFKGPLLLHELYDSIALRPMADIDILVKKTEMDRVNNVLKTLGYRSEPLRQWFLQEYYCLEYYHRSELPIEVHWELLHPQDFFQTAAMLPSACVWESARPINIGKGRAFAMSDETHLLYLCLHMAKHFVQRTRLIWACDIALILKNKKTTLDWPGFWRLAEDSGYPKLVTDALAYVEQHLGEGTGMRKQWCFFQDLAAQQNMLRDETTRLVRIGKRIARIPGVSAKIFSLFEYLFPHPERIAWKYGITGRRKALVWRIVHPCILLKHVMEELFSRIVGRVRKLRSLKEV